MLLLSGYPRSRPSRPCCDPAGRGRAGCTARAAKRSAGPGSAKNLLREESAARRRGNCWRWTVAALKTAAQPCPGQDAQLPEDAWVDRLRTERRPTPACRKATKKGRTLTWLLSCIPATLMPTGRHAGLASAAGADVGARHAGRPSRLPMTCEWMSLATGKITSRHRRGCQRSEQPSVANRSVAIPDMGSSLRREMGSLDAIGAATAQASCGPVVIAIARTTLPQGRRERDTLRVETQSVATSPDVAAPPLPDSASFSIGFHHANI